MVDNGWIKTDTAKNHHGTNITKIKVWASILILLIGSITVVLVHNLGSNATQYQSQGIVIDFGNYTTSWTEVDYNVTSDPKEMLTLACTEHGYSSTFDGEGKLTEINGITNTSTTEWGLWYVKSGSTEYTKADDYSIDASDYTVTTWAYVKTDATPTVAVDASGTSVYGYSQTNRLVTLSPVSTEIIGSLRATNSVVGTDMYSNYPSSITKGQNDGSIAIVGTYTTPSYESIMHLSPDMVVCDGSQYNHIQMSKTLRSSGVNAVVIYNGEDVNTILKNIFIVGKAIGYDLRAATVITDLVDAMDLLTAAVASQPELKVMITLSTVAAPYVAGNHTYASDILTLMGGINIYLSKEGWTVVNSEYIGPSGGSEWDPDIAIVIDGEYHATESDYNLMLNNLPANWKSTTAYSTGKIYLLSDGMGEMAQRSGPRFAQLSEIIARIVSPGAFSDGIILPKYIGSSYEDYLTITKDLGFDD